MGTKQLMNDDLKYCKYCDTTQPRSDFPKKGAKCKKCVSIEKNQYYEANKEEILENRNQYCKDHKEEAIEYQKQYYQDNKEGLLENNKQYYENNKKEILKKHNNYKKERRKIDPSFKLRNDFSRLVSMYLSKEGGSKNDSSCMDYALWTIDEFWEDFEKKFALPENLTPDGKVWITRYNRGSYNKKTWKNDDPSTWVWNIDHIKPHSEFPYTSMDSDLFRECWSLSNLRPLSAKQNVMDGVLGIRHLGRKSAKKVVA